MVGTLRLLFTKPRSMEDEVRVDAKEAPSGAKTAPEVPKNHAPPSEAVPDQARRRVSASRLLPHRDAAGNGDDDDGGGGGESEDAELFTVDDDEDEEGGDGDEEEDHEGE